MKILEDVKQIIDSKGPVLTVQEVRDIISNFPNNGIIIDVGCNEGLWISKFKNIIPKNVITIGIDPNYYNLTKEYTYYLNLVINLKDGEDCNFYIYKERACNSLYKIPEDKTKLNNEIFDLEYIKQVKTITLRTILNELKLNTQIIRYLKVDCQGSDLNVFKSLGEYIKNTQYVQLETSFQVDGLYENQSFYKQDFYEMDKFGFEPILYTIPSSSFTREGDVVYKNLKFKE